MKDKLETLYLEYNEIKKATAKYGKSIRLYRDGKYYYCRYNGRKYYVPESEVSEILNVMAKLEKLAVIEMKIAIYEALVGYEKEKIYLLQTLGSEETSS